MREFLKNMERKFISELDSSSNTALSNEANSVRIAVLLAFSRSASYALVRELKKEWPGLPQK